MRSRKTIVWCRVFTLDPPQNIPQPECQGIPCLMANIKDMLVPPEGCTTQEYLTKRDFYGYLNKVHEVAFVLPTDYYCNGIECDMNRYSPPNDHYKQTTHTTFEGLEKEIQPIGSGEKSLFNLAN